eukprot:1819197-Rhodomonas_salina.2
MRRCRPPRRLSRRLTPKSWCLSRVVSGDISATTTESGEQMDSRVNVGKLTREKFRRLRDPQTRREWISDVRNSGITREENGKAPFDVERKVL